MATEPGTGTLLDQFRWLTVIVQQRSHRAAQVASRLLDRWSAENGCCWPSHARLVADTGLSKDTVIRAIAELETHGFLGVTRPPKQGRGVANEYRPIWEKGGPTCYPSFRERGADQTPKRVATLRPEGGAELRHQPTEENLLKEPSVCLRAHAQAGGEDAALRLAKAHRARLKGRQDDRLAAIAHALEATDEDRVEASLAAVVIPSWPDQWLTRYMANVLDPAF